MRSEAVGRPVGIFVGSITPWVVAIVLASSAFAPSALASNQSQAVRVIATGKASAMPVARDWILTEPSLQGIIVPTREAGEVTAIDIMRLMRIYFPRTFEDLVSYDFLLLAQVDMFFINPKQAQWMYDAISDHGLGGANTRSVMSMNNWLSEPWAESILSEAFPNEPMAVIKSPYYHRPGGSLLVNDDDSIVPIMRPFKGELERIFYGYGGLLTVPRPGSRIHSWLKTGLFDVGYPKPGHIPHLFEWDYQQGITFTFMDMLYDSFWKTNVNPFALDIITNVIWHGSHRSLPDDAMMVHTLRDNLRYFQGQKSAVISVFEFAEKFGANTAPAYERIGELDVGKAQADQLYLGGDFESSYELINGLIDGLNEVAERALELKDQALVWVYVVEWLSVAGTSLVCGVVLWALMIRRRLFKEAGITKESDLLRLD